MELLTLKIASDISNTQGCSWFQLWFTKSTKLTNTSKYASVLLNLSSWFNPAENKILAMKLVYDLNVQNQEEIAEWLSQMKELCKCPTLLPEVTATYRNELLEEWKRLETWQKEELTESYEAELAEMSADSKAYGVVEFSIEELRNLPDDKLDELHTYLLFRIPKSVRAECFASTPQEKAELEKSVVKVQQITRDALERHATLEKIKKLGE